MADDQIQNKQPVGQDTVVGKSSESNDPKKGKPQKPSLLKLLSDFMRKDQKSGNAPKTITASKKSVLKLPAAFNAQKLI